MTAASCCVTYSPWLARELGGSWKSVCDIIYPRGHLVAAGGQCVETTSSNAVEERNALSLNKLHPGQNTLHLHHSMTAH